MIDATAVWTALLNNLPGLATLVTALVGSYVLLLGQRKAAATAAATEQKSNTKLDAIHAVVNSVHGTSLRLSAQLAQRVADLTKEPSDIGVAKAALKAADDHDAQQAALDAKN